MSAYQSQRGGANSGGGGRGSRGRGRGSRGGGYYNSRGGSDEERIKNDIQRTLAHEKRASHPGGRNNGLLSKQFQPTPRENGSGNATSNDTGRGGRYSKAMPRKEPMKFSPDNPFVDKPDSFTAPSKALPPRDESRKFSGRAKLFAESSSIPTKDESRKFSNRSNPFTAVNSMPSKDEPRRLSRDNSFLDRPKSFTAVNSIPSKDESKKFSKRSNPFTSPTSTPTDRNWRDPKSSIGSGYKERMSELYQTLKKNREKERKDAIRKGVLSDPDRPTSLANAITPVGTCQDMCPEFERVERVVQNMIDGCEKTTSPSGSRVPFEDHMVKRFRRSAAGYDEQLPSDIRPPLVLWKTLNYLFDEVIGTARSLGSCHKFVWDRTRGIRNDFSIQQVKKISDLKIAIDCFERIARFHILALHQLSQPSEDNIDFEHHQEREQLNNTLLSLMYYYDDSRHKLTSLNEAEFRAYCIIFEIQDQRPDMEDRAQNWPNHLLMDSRVQVAMKLYAAASNTIDDHGPLRPTATFPMAQAYYGRFWSIIGSNSVPYLLACAAEIYFHHIRGMALELIRRAYRRGGHTMDDLVLGDLAIALGFDDEDQVQSYCEDHGFTIGEREDGQSYLDVTSVESGKWLRDSKIRRKQVFSKNLVEKKRLGRTFLAVIHGLSVSKAREMGMVIESSTARSSLNSTSNDNSLFLTDDIANSKVQVSTKPKKPHEEVPKAGPLDPFTQIPQLKVNDLQSKAPFESKAQAMSAPSLPKSVSSQPEGALNKSSLSSKASLGFGSSSSSTMIFGQPSLPTSSDKADSILERPKAASLPTIMFGHPSSSSVLFGQPSLSASSDKTASDFQRPKAASLPSTAIFRQKSQPVIPDKNTSSLQQVEATSLPSTKILGEPSQPVTSDKATSIFQQPKASSPPSIKFPSQLSQSLSSDKVSQPKKPLFSFSENAAQPASQAASKDLTGKAPPKPFSFFPSPSDSETNRNQPVDTPSTSSNQVPSVSTVEPTITRRPFAFLQPSSTENSKATFSSSKVPSSETSIFNFSTPPANCKIAANNNPSHLPAQLPPQIPFQQTEASDSSSSSTTAPTPNVNPLFISQQSIQQQNSPFVPPSLIANPLESIHDPRPGHLDQLANSVFLQDAGILDQFIEHTISQTIFEEIQRNMLEQRDEDVAIARRIILSKKYCKKWRKLAWSMGLRRRGRERRKNYAESLRREYELSRSAALSASASHTASGSSSITNQQAARNVRPTSTLKRKSLESDSVEHIPNDEATSHKRHKQAGTFSSSAPVTSSTQLAHVNMLPPSAHITSKLKRKSLGSHPDEHVPHEDGPPRKKRKHAGKLSASSPMKNGHHKSHHQRSQTVGNSVSISQSGDISKSSSISSNFNLALPGDDPFLDEALMKKARRLMPRVRTDTTRTDYFRLKALGINPDTPIFPATRKRSSPDQLESTMFKHPRISSESSPSRSQTVPPANAVHPSIPVPAIKPAGRYSDADIEEVLKMARKAREEMEKSEAWYRKTREKMERRSSSGSSHRTCGHCSNGCHKTETEKERKLREFKWTPSRTEVRLRATNGGGLLPENYWEKRDAMRRGSRQTDSSHSSSYSAAPLGFATVNSHDSTAPKQQPLFASWAKGASADDAIEL